LKRFCVLQDHYDDERNKTMFHNTTPDVQDQDQDWFFFVSDRSCTKPMVTEYHAAVTEWYASSWGGILTAYITVKFINCHKLSIMNCQETRGRRRQCSLLQNWQCYGMPSWQRRQAVWETFWNEV